MNANSKNAKILIIEDPATILKNGEFKLFLENGDVKPCEASCRRECTASDEIVFKCFKRACKNDNTELVQDILTRLLRNREFKHLFIVKLINYQRKYLCKESSKKVDELLKYAYNQYALDTIYQEENLEEDMDPEEVLAKYFGDDEFLVGGRNNIFSEVRAGINPFNTVELSN
ncbi:MAG: hypothetical protein N4A44_03310 [Alphaproteobacteria bacterium]|jgi:hypothetical protein|nr:hypothetical protein [Alphaproteobacteria bacterium]